GSVFPYKDPKKNCGSTRCWRSWYHTASPIYFLYCRVLLHHTGTTQNSCRAIHVLHSLSIPSPRLWPHSNAAEDYHRREILPWFLQTGQRETLKPTHWIWIFCHIDSLLILRDIAIHQLRSLNPHKSG